MSHDLLIRRARPDDRPAMERICAQTWDWGDYIPEVWDRWLGDQQGALIVGKMDGEVVALSKITFQTSEQVWLEGMRVDPAYRERGIAGRFLEYALAYARDRQARVVRLSTGSHNKAIHALATRYGMHRTGAYVLWTAAALHEGRLPVFLDPLALEAVQSFLAHSAVLAESRGLYASSWAWQELSAERIAQFLNTRQLAACLTPQGNLAALAAIEINTDETGLWIGFADGPAPAPGHSGGSVPSASGPDVEAYWLTSSTAPPESAYPPVADLAAALRCHAAQIGVEEAMILLPEIEWLRTAFAQAGYGFGDWTGEMWVFELSVGQALQPATPENAPHHD